MKTYDELVIGRSSYFAEGSEAGHSDQQQQQQVVLGASAQQQSNNWLRDDSLRAQSLPPALASASASASASLSKVIY